MSPIVLSHLRNPRSLIGLAIALLAGVVYVTVLLQELSAGHFNPYLDVIFYLVLPPILLVGLFLVLSGVRRSKRRAEEAGGEADSAAPAWSTAATLGIAALFGSTIIFAVYASYSGYHYTESVGFCGTACHVPMGPVFTAHHASPHASVDCAKCHVGEGAAAFLRSKLAGTRQLIATLTDSFDRPIHTPVRSLRPESETCLKCHWREMSFGSRVVSQEHFKSDEKNTRESVNLVLHTGGGDPRNGAVTGIHWHSDALHDLEYVAVDDKRNVIPWVRVTTADKVEVFRSDGLPLDAPPPAGEMRKMDCMDCHNRPAHRYRTPDEILNEGFARGHLATELPYLKREAARLMAAPYETSSEAMSAIDEGLRSFYAKSYPEVASARAAEIGRAADYVRKGFEHNIFPEMRTDWRTESDHIGHKYYPGCFRCHDNRHQGESGRVIRRDCQLCHDSLTEVPSDGAATKPLLARGAYDHPFPLEGAHASLDCNKCHSGGPTPPPTCAGCHTDVADFRQGIASAFPGAKGEPDARHGSFECGDCHESAKAFTLESKKALCVNCHEEEFMPKAEAWLAELAAARQRAGSAAPSDAKAEMLRRLDKVHPFHNGDFALEVLKSIEAGPPSGN